MVPKLDSRNDWKRKIRIPCLLFVYFIDVLVITLSPFEFSVFWLRRLVFSDFLELLVFFFHTDILDIVSNILLFIPIGILLFFLLDQNKMGKERRRIWIPLCAGALLSLSIETAQLFLDRSSSFFDVVSNAGGTVLGFYGVGRWILVRRFVEGFYRRFEIFPVRFSFVLIYGTAFIMLFLLPLKFNHFMNWEEGFHLLIGNEETLDRPWEGEVYLVAVYDRALRLSEVQSLYDSGTDEIRGEIRRGKGAVVYYFFSEGRGDTIRDSSGRGESLDLVGQEVRWLDSGKGIEIREGGLLRSSNPGDKIVRALREASQMTVEVWMRTGNLNQSGPARIVSLSGDTDRRNFTLGQNGQDIHFRVRTPLTGSNGSRIRLKAASVLKDQDVYHVVATFNQGVARLIVDGRPTREVLREDVDYLPVLLELGRNTTAKVAFCFVFVFPLGLLVHGVFRRGRFLLTLLSVGGLVFFLEMFYYLRLEQPFGFFFFSVSFITAALGGVAGYAFDEEKSSE